MITPTLWNDSIEFVYYRLKEPILKSLWGFRKGFSVITDPNLNGFGWNLDINVGPQCALSKKFGNHPRGSAKCRQNVFCFSSTSTIRPFGRLSCTDLDHVWNSRREWVFWSIHPWEISAQGICKPKKTAPGCSISIGVLVTSLQLKWHNCVWQKAFCGLVDIPEMSHFVC